MKGFAVLAFLLMASTAYAQDTFKEGLQPSPIIQPANQLVQGGESTPKPDPTRITTEAIAALKQQMMELFGAKFDAMTKELDRLQKELDDRPKTVLVDEKFKGVDQQFAGRDTALAAALLAQKTSVEEQNKSNALSAAKAEAGFDKRIADLSSLTTNQIKASDDKINDVKERLTAIESRGQGASDNSSNLISYIAAAASLGSLIMVIVVLFARRDGPNNRPAR